jgi:hypothetical protein
MSTVEPVEPLVVTHLVEQYVDNAVRSAIQYENSEPLDDNGVFVLHELAAKIYALGWREGRSVAEERQRRLKYRPTPDVPVDADREGVLERAEEVTSRVLSGDREAAHGVIESLTAKFDITPKASA